MSHEKANYGPTTFRSAEKGREIQLKRRREIVTELQNLPVPVGSKAYDIIWEASDIIEAYELELETSHNRNNVLKERLVELEARLDLYFGVGEQ